MKGGGFLEDFAGEFIADSPLGDDHFLLDRRVVRVAERAEDASARVLAAARVALDLDLDPLPAPGAPALRGCDHHGVGNPLLLGLDPGAAPIDGEAPDQRFVRALDNVGDAPLPAAVRAGPLHPGGDPIAVHRALGARALDVNVGLFFLPGGLDDDESVALGVPPEFSHIDREALGQGVARAHPEEHALPPQGAHAFSEGGAILGRNPERADHLAHGHRPAFPGEEGEDCLIG